MPFVLRPEGMTIGEKVTPEWVPDPPDPRAGCEREQVNGWTVYRRKGWITAIDAPREQGAVIQFSVTDGTVMKGFAVRGIAFEAIPLTTGDNVTTVPVFRAVDIQ